MYNVDKEQLLNDFFRSLRGTLTNSFSYSKNHPYFIKSVENFKSKLDALLVVVNPLKIGITSSGVMVDGKNLDKAGFFEDLAHLLHRRKIKSIEIRPGVTLRDLISLFSVISLQQEVIAKGGGVNVLLAKQSLFNLTIEELDYSMFLQEAGQECTDIWSYMLKEAVQSNDETKINSLADNFGTLIQRSGQNEIFQAPEIPAAINEFLISLRNKDPGKFAKCSKDIFLWLLHIKDSIGPEKLDKLRQIFDRLSQEDLSNLFWEGLSQEDNFDDLSVQFFAKITGQNDPEQIARGVVNKINTEEGLRNNPRVAKRIRNLLTSPQTGQVSAVYRNTLESLVKGISFSGVLFFDQKELKRNYRYIVLNILLTNEDKDNLLLATEVLANELAVFLKIMILAF
jgi:hypothetical protein